MERSKKTIAVILIVSILNQGFLPTVLYALTSGPTQPEVNGFEPIGTNEMVNLFTGDFTYNIPLMDIGGYPLNLAYHSGITMDQEASWTGLGWNINTGVINRNMRGLPDDFKGDSITKEMNILENKTWGLSTGISAKIYGVLGLNADLGMFKNNYKGWGTSIGISPSVSAGKGGSGGMTASLGLNLNSQEGASVSASVNYQSKSSENESGSSMSVGASASVNTRSGFKGLTLSYKETFNNSHGPLSAENSSHISFSTPAFTPTINIPMDNFSFSFNGSLGGQIYGIHPGMSFTGFYSEQKLLYHKRTLPGFGYLFAQDGYQDESALMDFNREKDFPYVKGIKNLPIPIFTFDLFSASGQGMEGQFRAYRSDAGVLYDSYCQTSSNSLDGGVELGGGNSVHGGFTISSTMVNTETKKWTDANEALEYVNFVPTNDGKVDHLFENSYFKNIGEKTVNDPAYVASIGNTDPLQIDLIRNDAIANRQFNRYSPTNSSLNSIELSQVIKKTQRAKRHQLFSYLNTTQATYIGFDKKIYSYKTNDFVSAPKKIDRLMHPSQQMSEITITNKDGKRYIYGIPAFNKYQKEATFAVYHESTAPESGIITYSTVSQDNTAQNSKGKDHYYSAEILPGYAHSFLLTAVLSPDYIDVTGNGISDDDLGQAIKFNYTRHKKEYNWRVPFENKSANYNEGIISNNEDEKGSYIYGRKEIWYTHSIESKNFVARFILQGRKDAIGVLDENGGLNANDTLLCVKEIQLFSKSDLYNSNHPIPIKTVHFEYDYSLCKNVPNNFNTGSEYSNSGKLTLKKLYFTYGNNSKGKLNSYEFHYDSFNPDYHLKEYDRWGSYMRNKFISNYPLISYFPYTNQLRDSTDLWSSSWHMTSIDLPSGGTIKVSYESKDYAYVQDKRAMQMFQIDRIGSTSAYPSSNENLFDDNENGNQYIYIKVKDTVTTVESIKRKYMEGISKIYFKCFVDVNHDGGYEYVPGYADIDSVGIPDGYTGGDLFYLKLHPFTISGMSAVNPISKACWQYLKLNLPEKAYPNSQNDGDFTGLIKSLVGAIFSVGELFSKFDKHARNKGCGRYIDCAKSWVRLDNPNYCKLGGGCRVKEIRVSDFWDYMSDGSASYKEYGQKYDYTTTIKIGNSERIISSGVAAYEPMVGGDEIALRNPLSYSSGDLLTPRTFNYTETPLGESLYPAPMIGYSKVTVSSIHHKDNNPYPSNIGTGKTVNQFYTAKDFPVKNNYTNVKAKKLKFPPLFSMFGVKGMEYHTASQGFTIIVNDMHGKNKSEEIFNESNALISGTYYHYKSDDFGRLDNTANVVQKDSTISEAVIGKDIDMWLDMRQQQTDVVGPGVNTNLELYMVGVFPILVPIPMPKFSAETTRFRSATVVKYIQQFGILDYVVKTNNGSRIRQTNVLFDSETGDPILTETQNEFDDPLYNFTYPAYWAYDGMGPAYKNSSATFVSRIENGEVLDCVSPELYFHDGDEVLISGTGGSIVFPMKAWVANCLGHVKLIDKNGSLITISKYSILIYTRIVISRSGRRNMSSLPIGTISYLQNSPVRSDLGILDLGGNSAPLKIVNTYANEFSQEWKRPCENVLTSSCDTTTEWPLSEECVEAFIGNIVHFNNTHNENLFMSSADDSLTVGSIISMYGSPPACDSEVCSKHVFALNPSSYPFTPFTLAFGDDCYITIMSTSSNVVSLDSINSYSLGSDGCVLLLHKVDPDDPYSEGTTIAKACITCWSCLSYCVDGISEGEVINPYIHGMKGTWHSLADYVYYNKRVPIDESTSILRNDGYFNSFIPFWKYYDTNQGYENNAIADPSWTMTKRVTNINQNGEEIENVDALNKYSGALFGYNLSLAKAVANNATFKRIANDNFEDYNYSTSGDLICRMEHWTFRDSLNPPLVNICDSISHTGRYSLKLGANKSISVVRPIQYLDDGPTVEETDDAYVLAKGCQYRFSPDSGEYIISAWVKDSIGCNPITYSENKIHISYSGSLIAFDIYPSGKIIEGWQRYESKFVVPPDATAIEVKLIAFSSPVYFDDIRIHPFNSNMKCFVYDPTSLKLKAQLDENNFATFYEYDDEGSLIRVKKETERGILTLKETRNSIVKR